MDVLSWGKPTSLVALHCDNQTATVVEKDFNDKRRDIYMRLIVVKEVLKNEVISLDYIKSEKNMRIH